MLRLRQLVLAARDLAPAVDALRELLSAPPPYRDPDIGAFGLENAVLLAGQDLVEVVCPVRPDAAAARWLDRRGPGPGDGGYMLMVDGPPALVDADRLAALDLRVVHRVELPDVTDVHLHPRDVGGALLALDTVDPPGSWRWGGPALTGRAAPAAGGLRSVTLAVAEPDRVAARWAQVLDLAPGPVLALDGGRQSLRVVPTEGPEGVVAATLALAVPAPRSCVVAGVALDVVPLEEEP